MEQLLSTKLFIPTTRSELVSRPWLIEKLNKGLSQKLTLISAPAGFGKTTLASSWIQTMGEDPSATISIAWLSLDEGDNDPFQFLTYFIAALIQAEAIDPKFGNGMQSILQSPQPPPSDGILTSLINEISSNPGRIILVLDDYHLIQAQPIHEALSFLLEHLPTQMHHMIVTREDPHLPLARLRARGQLSELRANDLRFTSAEAAEFLNQVMGLSLSVEDIAMLETRTEGWIAGLQLAAISMQSSQDIKAFIQSFAGSHRFVLDYLIEEVLEQQPESVQTFMLQTAILDRLTGSLCDAVTGQENGQETLEMLDHANLFLIPLDNVRQWYRYHHLLADLLHQRLRQIHLENLPNLHIRASEWFNQQGLYREAITHSLAARDYQRAAESIIEIAIDIVQQGEHTKVVEWINELPEELVKEQPNLGVLHAWALQLTGQLEAAEAHLVDAENALNHLKYKSDEDIDSILGLINSRRAYSFFMIGDHIHTISYAKQALDQLPETATLIKVQTALLLGVAYRYMGHPRLALDVYNETLPIIQNMGGNSTTVLCYLHLGDLHSEMAQLHQAKDIYEDALRFTERHIGRSEMPFTGYVYVRIGCILRQWNQLEEAYHYTSKGVSLCREWNVADILSLSCIEFANILWAMGNHDQAREFYLEAIQIMKGFSPWGSKYAAAYQAKFDIGLGNIDAAERWARSNDLITDGDFQFHREIEYLALVRLLIAQKEFKEAHSLTERIFCIAQEIGKKHTELEGLILLSMIIYGQGDIDQALEYLQMALAIAEPEGFVRIFVDEGPQMAHLLYEALNRGIAPDYVRQLLAAFPNIELEQTNEAKAQSSQYDLIEPLSEREIEILQLVAKGLTNQVIATRLYLSLNTVKVHTRNIYAKLNVHNRTEAVDRARALGVLTSNEPLIS